MSIIKKILSRDIVLPDILDYPYHPVFIFIYPKCEFGKKKNSEALFSVIMVG